jgi:hypothetical protein
MNYADRRKLRLKRARRFFAMVEAGDTLQQIAEQEGISRQRVQQIVSELPEYRITPRFIPNVRRDTAFVTTVIQMRRCGYTYRDIGRFLGVTKDVAIGVGHRNGAP